jgi:hypothetical protein
MKGEGQGEKEAWRQGKRLNERMKGQAGVRRFFELRK